MRKSTMKKLFATLAVAMTASVGAGVALINNIDEASAATSVINSCEQSTGAYAIDTNSKRVDGTISNSGVTEGTGSLYLTSDTAWFNVFLSVGSFSLDELKSYDSISFDITAAMGLNWHVIGTHFQSSVANETTTVTLPVDTLVSNAAAFIAGSPNYIQFVVQATTAPAQLYIDNVSLTGTGSSTGGNSGSSEENIADNFSTNATISWSGDTASYTDFADGNYIATDKAYEFASNEVLVFETTFVTNELFMTANMNEVAYNFSFIYGEDNVTAFSDGNSKYDGHSIIGQSFIAASQEGNYINAKSQVATGWVDIPNPSGKLTYYIHADGGADIFLNGIRQAYISGAQMAANLNNNTNDQGAARAKDRNGYLGWTFSGTNAFDFSYSSMKVGKVAEFAVGTGEPGEVTWLASHTNTAIPSAPATTVNGTLLNNCEGAEAYWFGTNGTRESSTDVKSQGNGSYKLALNAYSYMTPLLTIDGAILTEEQFLAYDGIYLEIYNPGSAVNLFLYNTLAAELKTGWNQVSIPMTTIVEQLALSKADRVNNPTCPLQFEGGQFFLSVGAACELYVDNIRGITPAGGGGEEPTPPPAQPTTPGVLQDFESVDIKSPNTGMTNVELSTEHVTQGSYSNKVTVSSVQWFQLEITLDSSDLSGDYTHIAFDYYLAGGLRVYSPIDTGEAYLPASGTHTIPIANAPIANNVLTMVCVSAVQAESYFYIDNLRLVKVEDSGGGDDGGDTPDTPGSDIEITGKTQYTQFNSASVSGWTADSSAVSVSNGALKFNGGGTYVTTDTYKNFILEYDLTVNSRNETHWVPLASIGVNNTNYSVDLQKSIVLNAWGAVFGYKLDITPYAPSPTVFTQYDTSAPTTHVKLVAQDGTLTLSLSLNGQTHTQVLCSGVDTAGKIAITACAGTTLTIDNLVVINSDEYTNYNINKIIFANSSVQANANESLSGDLLEAIKAKAAADGIDITKKTFSFRSKTDGFFLNSMTGKWDYQATNINGSYLLEYVITVNDLVLDGWVYPLGDKGVYTIEGNIVVDVMGGIDPGQGGGGGAGDTSELPVVVGSDSVQHIVEKIQDQSFIIDTKGYSIIGITLTTEKGNENVKHTAYTVTEVAEGMQVTFKGDFLALLTEKTHEFKISTAKGTAIVFINVYSLKAPTLSGETAVEMKKYSEKDAVFMLDTDGLDILTVLRLGSQLALSNEAYTFVDNTLTIKKEYLATLPADTHTFVIYTEGGEANVTITIKPVDEPLVVGEETLTFNRGSNEDVVFDIEFFGENVIQVLRDGASKALNERAYEFSVEECTFTFKAEYLLTLTDDVNIFVISTRGGDVYVTIEIVAEEFSEPTINGANSKTVTLGSKTNVTFDIDTQGAAITSILRSGAADGLSTSAFTYEGTTLTLLGEYVALLPAGNNVFTLATLGGTVEFTIVVDAVKLSTPVVTLNGNVATWTAVDGAVSYQYKINGGAEQTATQLSVTLTSGQSIQVKAVGDGEITSDSDWSEAVTYTANQLATPIVNIVGNNAVWDEVEDAVGYKYKIDNGVEQVATQRSVALVHGQSIQVKAIGNNETSLDSDWSDAKTYNANALNAPIVTLNGNVAIWAEIEGATGYVYKINNGTEQSTTVCSIGLTHGQKIVVKAVDANGEKLDSDWSNEVAYIADKLDAPVVTLNGNEASWTAVAGAVNYTYSINGQEQTIDGLSVTLEVGQKLIVKANGNGTTSLDSNWSNEVSLSASKLATPVVTLNKYVASWTAVDGAIGYVYKLNGVEQTASVLNVTLKYGDVFQVKASGDGVMLLDSDWSAVVMCIEMPEQSEDEELEEDVKEDDTKDETEEDKTVDDFFTDDNTEETPDDGEQGGAEDDEQQPSGGNENSYEESFTGSVKPSQEAFNKYMEGLESGGQVSSGCNGLLSVMAGLPMVGLVAWFIRKKKEDK